MNIIYLQVLFSICCTIVVHDAFEIWGARQKVQWLKARTEGQKHGKWPFDIDSLPKVVVLHTLLFVVVGVISFVMIQLASLSKEVLVVGASVMLVASYTHTTYRMDLFHTEIGELLSRYPKK